MEHQKILNLMNDANNSKFLTREWIIVNYNLKANYDGENETTYNTEVLKSNICDYNDAYILIRGDITVAAAGATQVVFKSCAPLTKSITKIDGTTIDDAEDLDLVIPRYNLMEYSSKDSETTASLWFYSKGDATNFNADIENTYDFKSFKYKAKLIGNTVAEGTNGILKNAKIAVPLKSLSNFWRSLEMPLINCQVELRLKWTKYCFVCTWY